MRHMRWESNIRYITFGVTMSVAITCAVITGNIVAMRYTATTARTLVAAAADKR